jgi:galactarate dehydratase
MIPQFPFHTILLRLHPQDPVAVARQDIPAGAVILADPAAGFPADLVAREAVPAGHKIALAPIEPGGEVQRYGYPIGIATRRIDPGDWVHTHNLSVPSQPPDRAYHLAAPEPLVAPAGRRTFLGFPRPGGRAGTRNYIAVISTSICSAQAAQGIAAAFTKDRLGRYPNVDGVVAIVPQTGCCVPMNSQAFSYLQRSMLNTARNPNFGGTLFISLGCEGNQMEPVVDTLEWDDTPRPPVLVIQELGGLRGTVEAGVKAVEALLPQVNACARAPMPASALTLALQCGGSDGWSGVTANPLVGLVSDRIVRQGGTAVLAETPEIYGAEHLLANRVAEPEVGRMLVRLLESWEAQAQQYGFSLDNNPSPGNKQGGITTIFEKSLGAVAKAGSTALAGVYDYAELVDRKGLVFMDSPGFDPASVTGELAGGCNLILFTTGRGSVYGTNLAPCIKIATNTPMYERMQGDMDYNAGAILEGKSMDQAAGELFEMVLEIASGKPAKSEGFGFREGEFVIWQPGGWV